QTITSVNYQNFKALKGFSLALRHMNVLVGPNNSGKSTVLGAFRLLATALRRANAKSSTFVGYENDYRQGYPLRSEDSPISLENVHSDYSDRSSSVTFRLSNGKHLELHFPVKADAVLVMPG